MRHRRALAAAVGAVALLAAACSSSGGDGSAPSTASTAADPSTVATGTGSSPPSSVFGGGINGPVAPGSTAAATRTQRVCDGAPLDAVGRVLGGAPTALPPVESSGAGFYVTCAWGAGAATLDADYALAADLAAADRDWAALKASLGPSAQPVAGVGEEALATVTGTLLGARSGRATLRLAVTDVGATPVLADLATIGNGVLRAGG